MITVSSWQQPTCLSGWGHRSRFPFVLKVWGQSRLETDTHSICLGATIAEEENFGVYEDAERTMGEYIGTLVLMDGGLDAVWQWAASTKQTRGGPYLEVQQPRSRGIHSGGGPLGQLSSGGATSKGP